MKKNELITLLGYYLNILPPRWQGMQTYIALYITLVSSILGVLIAGATTIKNYPENFYLIPGYILLFMICKYAKTTIIKQNKHLKELIVIIAKIEKEIGLYDYNTKRKDIPLWDDDEYFLTPKWIEARFKSGRSSYQFINSFQDSSAKYIYYLFTVIQFIGFIILIFTLFLSYIRV